jgi:hypothetical protein
MVEIMQEEKQLSIIKEDDNKVSIKYNKSYFFLLPMINLSSGSSSEIINTYIGIKGEKLDFSLYVLKKNPEYKMRALEGYIRDLETIDGFLYQYKIPEKFEEDYMKFIAGKYSEFSNSYKNKIYSLLQKPYRETNVYKVLNKSLDARKLLEDRIGQSIGDQEVLSIPDIDKELYG